MTLLFYHFYTKDARNSTGTFWFHFIQFTYSLWILYLHCYVQVDSKSYHFEVRCIILLSLKGSYMINFFPFWFMGKSGCIWNQPLSLCLSVLLLLLLWFSVSAFKDSSLLVWGFHIPNLLKRTKPQSCVSAIDCIASGRPANRNVFFYLIDIASITPPLFLSL